MLDIIFFSGKIVTLRDLSNMKARISSGNDLMTLVADLHKDSTLTIDVFTDEDNNLLDIFYQDARMRSLYASFPEMLFVDATHKLTNLRMPLYVFVPGDVRGRYS